jgi:hypothetical protein
MDFCVGDKLKTFPPFKIGICNSKTSAYLGQHHLCLLSSQSTAAVMFTTTASHEVKLCSHAATKVLTERKPDMIF